MLQRRKKYLQIALNSTLEDAEKIIQQIPLDERILIEAGTPLIKEYGANAIKSLRMWWQARVLAETMRGPKNIGLSALFRKKRQGFNLQKTGQEKKFPEPYIVADIKCMDRGAREVYIAKEGGAQAATVLGQAPVETINAFIEKCQETGLDSMIDMMNVPSPLTVLRLLKKPPRAVILHRGVDEEHFNPDKQIPYHYIQQIKGSYNDVLVSVAGGDTIREVQRSVFNDADIVVVWRDFYQSSADIGKLAQEFLKQVR